MVARNEAEEERNQIAPHQDTQTRSRLIIGEFGPSDSALAASSGGRLSPPSRRGARGALRFSGPVLGRRPLALFALGCAAPRRSWRSRCFPPSQVRARVQVIPAA